MILDMPRKLPPFVHRERSRHGKLIFYFRQDRGKRRRLPLYGSPEFDGAYKAALAGRPAPKHRTVSTNSLEWLIGQYRLSPGYQALSRSTRRQCDNIFKNAIKVGGTQSYHAVTTSGISNAIAHRKPAAARNFYRAMRGLFKWAVKCGYVESNPTDNIERPTLAKSNGFEAWTDDDVAAYEARWPDGSRQRVWMHVLLYTGLRRGDAVRIGRQHVKDGIASIRTEKSGLSIEVTISIGAELHETLTRGPTGDLAWICGARGEPLTKESFGNLFRSACNEAGIEKSAHGLRKLAATKAAEAGLSVAEIEALFGWEGGRMASHYTKTANRRSLAIQAAGKIANAKSLTLKQGAGAGAKKRVKTSAKN